MALVATFADPLGGFAHDRIGRHHVVVKDVTVTSDAANDTGVITLTAAAFGLDVVTGVIVMGTDPLGTDSDFVGYARIDLAADGSDFILTPKTVAAAAIDLDATDFYTVRLQVWGF